MRQIDRIIIHCSDSMFGNVDLIRQWHLAKGWDNIGYHFVILNGYPTADSLRLRQPQFWLDGNVQIGRDIETAGAHTRGYNSSSIGICLIGENQFTLSQFKTLRRMVRSFLTQYPGSTISGHYELCDNRTCPNIEMNMLRKLILEPIDVTGYVDI